MTGAPQQGHWQPTSSVIKVLEYIRGTCLTLTLHALGQVADRYFADASTYKLLPPFTFDCSASSALGTHHHQLHIYLKTLLASNRTEFREACISVPCLALTPQPFNCIPVSEPRSRSNHPLRDSVLRLAAQPSSVDRPAACLFVQGTIRQTPVIASGAIRWSHRQEPPIHLTSAAVLPGIPGC